MWLSGRMFAQYVWGSGFDPHQKKRRDPWLWFWEVFTKEVEIQLGLETWAFPRWRRQGIDASTVRPWIQKEQLLQEVGLRKRGRKWQMGELLFSHRNEPRLAHSTSVLVGPEFSLKGELGQVFREFGEVSGLLFSFQFLSNFWFSWEFLTSAPSALAGQDTQHLPG